jgi:spore coat polysaccharide biosynthesis predicted glycosyltransferase SpsG
MKWADVAVSAAGSTCWELCCTETPFMILVLADNQQRVATGLTRLNIVKNLGGGDGVEPLKTAESLTSLLKDPVERERMSLAGGRLADGLGAERVVRQLIENAGCTQDVESNHL